MSGNSLSFTSEDDLAEIERLVLSMTPEEAKFFGRYCMQYAHLDIFPTIHWDKSKDVVDIITKGKRYYRYWWVRMYLQEGKQEHFGFNE